MRQFRWPVVANTAKFPIIAWFNSEPEAYTFVKARGYKDFIGEPVYRKDSNHED